MSDNIGGITNARLALVKSIAVMKENLFSVEIGFKENGGWNNIPSGKYGVSVDVKPSYSDAGDIYNVTVVISVPRQCVTDDLLKEYRQLIKFGTVFSYTVTDGTYIVGSKSFPLKGSLEAIQSKTATGFSGYRLTFTCKQTFGQRLLTSL